MPKINTKKIISRVNQIGIKTIIGRTKNIDIEFSDVENGSFEEFLDFAHNSDIKYIFYLEDKFSQSLIDEKLITEEMISRNYVPDELMNVIEKEVEEYNDDLIFKSKYIGETIFLILFFSLYGTTYSISFFNDDLLLVEDPDEVLKEIIEDHRDAINKINHEKREKELEAQNKLLKELEDELINNDQFHLCTNKQLRRDFVYAYVKENTNEQHGRTQFLFNDAVEVAEKVWRAIKLKRKGIN